MFWPLIGTAFAVAVTTAMDANGLSVFSALPLFPLLALFLFVQRFSRAALGFKAGRRGHYFLAVYYPLVVLGAAALIAFLGRGIDLSATDWTKAALNLVLMTVSTALVVIVTEEGFFRGWLWASLGRAGRKPEHILIWSSAAFALWHVSAVTLETGFELPRAQVPIYIVNVFFIGWIWGFLRLMSGSVLVPSLSHGLWNGLVYVLFGYGTKVGALGIEKTSIFGPEVGIFGLILNMSFAYILWRQWRIRRAALRA